MPGGDGTGPAGMGPMTGRGMGWCVEPVRPGAGPARGLGRGFGRGFGFRRGFGGGGMGFGRRRWAGFGAPQASSMPNAPNELDELRRLSGIHEGALADIRRRIEDIEASNRSGSAE